jgi:hypothetical protein
MDCWSIVEPLFRASFGGEDDQKYRGIDRLDFDLENSRSGKYLGYKVLVEG